MPNNTKYQLADPYIDTCIKCNKKEILNRPQLLGGNVKLIQGNVFYDTDKLLEKLRKKVLKGVKNA